MKFSFPRLSPRLPWWIWAALGGSLATSLTMEVLVALSHYRDWEATAMANGRVMYVTLGEHLRGTIAASFTYLALLTILGLALAMRGRRLLFAAPVLSVTFGPVLLALYHGGEPTARVIPGLSGSWYLLAMEHGQWAYWIESVVKLVLVLLPGALMALRVDGRRDPFHVLAIAFLAVPATVAGWLGVIYFSYNGRLNDLDYLVAFAIGAALGFDRPRWPWVLVLVPSLFGSLHPLFFAHGADYLVIACCALLGAATVPLGRIFRRGWQEDPQEPAVCAHASH